MTQNFRHQANRAFIQSCQDLAAAYAAETLGDLCTVIEDNFTWCCRNGVIDAPLLEKYKSDFATCDIYVNTDAERGFLLCGNATVKAWSNATVEAYGNATVEAYGNTTVEAWNSAYCSSWSLIECKLSDNALYRVHATNTVYYSNANLKFVKQ